MGTEADVKTHLNYIVNQSLNDYTDNALLKLARIEYDHANYSKAGQYYGRLANITEEPLRKLEALEGGMKSNFFMENYDSAIEMGESLSQSRDLTPEQVNQINHIVGKSYVMKGNYATAATWLDKSANADRTVYGAESAYYSALASFKLNNLDDAENKVFNISDRFSSHEYWVVIRIRTYRKPVHDIETQSAKHLCYAAFACIGHRVVVIGIDRVAQREVIPH